jgi:hypothetical protein
MPDDASTTIFADECGYTGRALLDIEQPVFVLATLRLTEPQAHRLKRHFFAGHRGVELKHTKLARHQSGRVRILSFMRWLGANQHVVGLTYVHKEFALVAKMVDWILEPSFRLAGLDLYERGANIAFANLTFIIVRSVAGPAYLRELLSSFHELTQHPDITRLQNYVDVLNTYDEPEPLDQVLGYYRSAVAHLGLRVLDILDPSCLDLMWSYALGVMANWSKRGAAPFRLIQDQSSEMAREKDLWDAVTDPHAPQQLVGWDRRTIQYPIGITSTVLGSSHDWVGLQLADIVAGAITRTMREIGRAHV